MPIAERVPQPQGEIPGLMFGGLAKERPLSGRTAGSAKSQKNISGSSNSSEFDEGNDRNSGNDVDKTSGAFRHSKVAFSSTSNCKGEVLLLHVYGTVKL